LKGNRIKGSKQKSESVEIDEILEKHNNNNRSNDYSTNDSLPFPAKIVVGGLVVALLIFLTKKSLNQADMAKSLRG